MASTELFFFFTFCDFVQHHDGDRIRLNQEEEGQKVVRSVRLEIFRIISVNITIAHIKSIFRRVVHLSRRSLRSSPLKAFRQMWDVAKLLLLVGRLEDLQVFLGRFLIGIEVLVVVFGILDNLLLLDDYFFGLAILLKLIDKRVNVLNGCLNISNASSWNKVAKLSINVHQQWRSNNSPVTVMLPVEKIFSVAVGLCKLYVTPGCNSGS